MSRTTIKNGRQGRDTHGDEAPTPAANDSGGDVRDSQGRFTKNNAGGPGNPFALQVATLRSALIQAVTPDDIRAIALELLTQAKCGNLGAMKLLLSYVIGRPTPAPNPDAVELDEWQLRQQAPTAAEAQDTLFERRPPGLVNAAARAVAVAQQQEVLELFQGDAPSDKAPAEAAPQVGQQVAAGRLGAAPGAAGTVNKPCAADGVQELAAILRFITAPDGGASGNGQPAAEGGG